MSEDVIEALELFGAALENAVQVLKQSLPKIEKLKPQAQIPEKETFEVLKWIDEKGTRLGDYQASYRNHSASDAWQHGFNFLKVTNSLINFKYHEPGYEYAYWIYPAKYEDRIFRKKLTEKEALANGANSE